MNRIERSLESIRKPRVLVVLALLLALTVPDGAAQTSGIASKVTKAKRADETGATETEGTEDEVFKTPELSQTTIEGVAPENVPLYRRYPPDRVVVGEVGNEILTRAELDRLALSKALMVSGRLWVAGEDEEVAKRQEENRLLQAEQEVLYEWASVKCLAHLARQKGVRVSEEEVDEKIALVEAEGKAKLGSENLEKTRSALGIASDELRRDMREALLIDKFVLQDIEKTFTDQGLKAMYDATPARYATPKRYHVLRILKKTSPTMSRDERRDVRKDLYKICKKLEDGDAEAFKEVARKETQDERTRESGGDMGWLDASSVGERATIETMLALELGRVSDIVETPGGFLVLMVTEIEEATGQTFDAAARKRVIDALVFEYRRELGPLVMRDPSLGLKVRLNSSGLRVLDEAIPGRTAATLPTRSAGR